VRLSFSADLNPLVQQEGEHHWRSFIATVILVIALVVPQLIRIYSPPDYTNTMAIAVSITGYVLYLLIGCICNDIHEYLRSIQHGEGFENEYSRVRGLIGQFDFTCECYHYETRHHVRYHDHDGHQRAETYTTQEKVVTHTAAESIVPSKTSD
jgi:Ca2+/H+ antiporter